jgi:branched-chain amino acid transport system ATP-binding protein
MLEVINLNVSYGDAQALWDISLSVGEGEIVTVVGPNGAGKSTLVNTLAGMAPASSGQVWLNRQELTSLPAHEMCRRGVAIVPEGRRVFPQMTVCDNLAMGSFAPEARPHHDEILKWVYTYFPTLKERSKQRAGTLSGGEQQMLAIGRALMARPKLLLLDEPSLGLAPLIVDLIFEVMQEINKLGVSILLVEQHIVKAFEIASRGYILEEGRIIQTGEAANLLEDRDIKRTYLAYQE